MEVTIYHLVVIALYIGLSPQEYFLSINHITFSPFSTLFSPKSGSTVFVYSVAVSKYLDFLRRINRHPARRSERGVAVATVNEDNDAGGDLDK